MLEHIGVSRFETLAKFVTWYSFSAPAKFIWCLGLVVTREYAIAEACTVHLVKA
jgi:hypothetical protein